MSGKRDLPSTHSLFSCIEGIMKPTWNSHGGIRDSRFDHILLPSQALEGVRVGSRAARTGTVAPIWMLTFPVENSLQYHDAGPLSELFANGLHTS